MSATAVRTGWVCSTCGQPDAHPLPGYTSFDPRYTTGYCDSCTDPHPDKPRKSPRPTSALVRAEDFDPAAWQEQKDRKRLKALVGVMANGRATFQMTDKECYELVTLYDRWGFPGAVISESVRTAAARYSTPAPEKKGKKRR